MGLAPQFVWGQNLESALRKGISSLTKVSVLKAGEPAVKDGIYHFPPSIPTGLSEKVLRGVFQANELKPQTLTNLFSGVAFTFQNETYIALAAHPFKDESFLLGKTFTANIYTADGGKEVTAELIYATAPSMLDIVVGRVLEGEEELRPFTISHHPFSVGEQAVSYGFARQKLVEIPGRTFVSQTPLCFRTTMPFPRDERPGLCGSALLYNGELLGVHTGSSCDAKGCDSEDERFDVGHATKATLLEELIKAFQNDGKGTFPLVLNGQKVLDLPLDGYISYVKLFDQNGKMLWQRGFDSKFAYDQVNENIRIFNPSYIELTTRRVHLQDGHLREIRNRTDGTRRTYLYNLPQGQLERVSKPKE